MDVVLPTARGARRRVPGRPEAVPPGRWLLFGWPVVLAAFGFGVALDRSTYREGGGTVPGRAPAWAPEAVGTTVGLLALAGFAALLIGSAAAILVHYRNGDSRLRRQIRWLALSAFLLPLVLLTTWFCYLLGARSAAQVVVVAGLLVAYFGMPVGTAVAVLRHDLSFCRGLSDAGSFPRGEAAAMGSA